MGRYCSASGCTNSDFKNKSQSLGLSFHSFPLKNHAILKLWIQAIKRKDFVATGHSCLCSTHFKEEDFEFQPFTGVRRIKQGAVPSIFTYSKKKRNARQKTHDPEVNIKEESHQTQEVQTELTGGYVNAMKEQDQLIRICGIDHSGQCLRFHGLDSQAIQNFTGFDKKTFKVIFDFFSLNEALTCSTKPSQLSPEDQLLLTLMKMRQDLTNGFLSNLFKVKLNRIQTCFQSCLAVLYQIAKSIDIWPSRELVKEYMPLIFYQHYPACRVIIDVTEFRIQKPRNPSYQQASFSTYKNKNTLKSLIGISPSGAFSFISHLWLGGISDQELTKKSGLLDLLEEGDIVLANRGFISLQSEFDEKGITLITPRFLRDKIQFQVEERGENKGVSSHRCHVERAICKLKQFKVLNCEISLGMKYFEEMYFVCAFLSNFSVQK